jgi:hypothetical protein
MALQQQIKFKTQFGEISVDNVYIKVVDVVASKQEGIANLRYFKGKDGNVLKESKFDFPVELDGKNFIAQAYEHIKTLPEFSQAIDV